MDEEIKIIIADDNKTICQFIVDYLKKHEEIKIIGIAHTDDEERRMIEELKPDIVITDLVRNGKYSGLDIIREYCIYKNSPEFLVISADAKEDVIKNGIYIAGYLQKGVSFKYEKLYDELKRIKSNIKK